jgi:hypothetical protein
VTLQVDDRLTGLQHREDQVVQEELSVGELVKKRLAIDVVTGRPRLPPRLVDRLVQFILAGEDVPPDELDPLRQRHRRDVLLVSEQLVVLHLEHHPGCLHLIRFGHA